MGEIWASFRSNFSHTLRIIWSMLTREVQCDCDSAGISEMWDELD